jgi:sugar lactone lactonase YvrE
MVVLVGGFYSRLSAAKITLVVTTRSGIIQFDAETGAIFTPLVDPGNQALPESFDFVVGPDGNIYSTSNRTHEVIGGDGQTGTWIDT